MAVTGPLVRPSATETLRELRPYLFAATVVLALGMATGIALPVLLPDAARSMGEGVSEFIDLARDLSQGELFLFIVVNNTVKALAMMYLGVFFGLVPALFLLFNGAALAVVVAGFSLTVGVGAAAAALLPHGVIELTAIVVAAALGLRLGATVAARLRRARSRPVAATPLRPRLAEAWHIFSRLLAPALLLAAAIETWITPIIVAPLLP